MTLNELIVYAVAIVVGSLIGVWLAKRNIERKERDL